MTSSPGIVRGWDWETYWSRYLPYLAVITAVFALGLLFGSLATEVLSASERVQLTAWMEALLHWESTHFLSSEVYQQALVANIKLLGLLYVLGISVAGIPLVLAVLFLRGFVVGFAMAFLAQASVHRLVIPLATVVAQNIFLVPLYLMAGTLALWFSWNLIRPNKAKQAKPFRAFGGYTIACSLLAAGMFWASAVEVAGSPLLLHLMTSLR